MLTMFTNFLQVVIISTERSEDDIAMLLNKKSSHDDKNMTKL